MKALTAATTFENCRKKLTNHSMRKTTVKKLKATNVPKSSIIKITGHTSTRGLKRYDPGDQNEFCEMCNALNPPSASPSTSLSIQSASSSSLAVLKTKNRPTYSMVVPLILITFLKMLKVKVGNENMSFMTLNPLSHNNYCSVGVMELCLLNLLILID